MLHVIEIVHLSTNDPNASELIVSVEEDMSGYLQIYAIDIGGCSWHNIIMNSSALIQESKLDANALLHGQWVKTLLLSGRLPQKQKLPADAIWADA